MNKNSGSDLLNSTITSGQSASIHKHDKNNLHDVWLAGGCFWGVEEYFKRIGGVVETDVGYANGRTEYPTYHDLHETGHVETVHVRYDTDKLNLQTLLEYYFKIIDPVSKNKQGNDIGTQYRTGIYYCDEKDKEVIQKVIDKEQQKYAIPIVIEVLPLLNYYLAEEYHQDYLKKNPNGYCHIDFSSMPKISESKINNKE